MKKGSLVIPLLGRAAKISMLLFIVLTLYIYEDATALFTDQKEMNTGAYTTAIVSLEVTKPAGIDLNVSNLVPGDTVNRDLTVTNTGSVAFTYALYLSAPTAPPPSLLWTGADGLKFQVTDDGTGQAVGTLAPAASISQGAPISMGQLDSGQNKTIRIQIALPSSADNTYQNLTQTMSLVFFAQQLAGTSR